MRLEDAASILGVPVDSDIDAVRQKYKKLSVMWNPEKASSDPKAKEKFQQLSMAFSKLISHKCGDDIDEGEVDDEERQYDDDVHEMRAFMQMFMDLVGIFNDDKQSSNESTVDLLNQSEEWSTEDEDEEGDMDDDDDDDDSDSDGCDDNDVVWEPMVKTYFHMNLKEEASKEREHRLTELTEKEAEEMESRRKLKNAKKRAEKRRKQKEKKLKEAAIKAEEEDFHRKIEENQKKEAEEKDLMHREKLRLLQEEELNKRQNFLIIVISGNYEKVKKIWNPTEPSNIIRLQDKYYFENGQGGSILHYCVSELLGNNGSPCTLDANAIKVVAGRLKLAKLFLQSGVTFGGSSSSATNMIDILQMDDNRQNVIHYAARYGDVEFMTLVFNSLSDMVDRRVVIDALINARCRLGWTPLHYACEQGFTQGCQLLIATGALLTIRAHLNPPRGEEEGDNKGYTPMELVHQRIHSRPIATQKLTALKEIEVELTAALHKLEKARIQRDQEKQQKLRKEQEEKAKLDVKLQEERELLERKQKQLKMKLEKEKQKEEEENRRKQANATKVSSTSSVAPVTPAPVAITSTTSTTSHLEEKLKAIVTTSTTPAAATTSNSTTTTTTTATATTTTKSKKKKSKDKKKGQKDEEEEEDEPAEHTTPSTTAPSSTNNTNTASSSSSSTASALASAALAASELASRDEMVDTLLAMGFPEADCLAALTACGTNFDRAISWLCERPTSGSSTTTTTSESKSSHSTKTTKTLTTASTTASNQDKSDAAAAAALAQKEKDHKEELRRINRAWNAKVPQQRAEEEKKKAEAERQKAVSASTLQYQRMFSTSAVLPGQLPQQLAPPLPTNTPLAKPLHPPSPLFPMQTGLGNGMNPPGLSIPLGYQQNLLNGGAGTSNPSMNLSSSLPSPSVPIIGHNTYTHSSTTSMPNNIAGGLLSPPSNNNNLPLSHFLPQKSSMQLPVQPPLPPQTPQSLQQQQQQQQQQMASLGMHTMGISFMQQQQQQQQQSQQLLPTPSSFGMLGNPAVMMRSPYDASTTSNNNNNTNTLASPLTGTPQSHTMGITPSSSSSSSTSLPPHPPPRPLVPTYDSSGVGVVGSGLRSSSGSIDYSQLQTTNALPSSHQQLGSSLNNPTPTPRQRGPSMQPVGIGLPSSLLNYDPRNSGGVASGNINNLPMNTHSMMMSSGLPPNTNSIDNNTTTTSTTSRMHHDMNLHQSPHSTPMNNDTMLNAYTHHLAYSPQLQPPGLNTNLDWKVNNDYYNGMSSLLDTSLLSSSTTTNSHSSNMNYDMNDTTMDDNESYPQVEVDGAIELSAGAKPFIPKYSNLTSAIPSLPSATNTSNTLGLPNTNTSNLLSDSSYRNRGVSFEWGREEDLDSNNLNTGNLSYDRSMSMLSSWSSPAPGGSGSTGNRGGNALRGSATGTTSILGGSGYPLDPMHSTMAPLELEEDLDDVPLSVLGMDALMDAPGGGDHDPTNDMLEPDNYGRNIIGIGMGTGYNNSLSLSNSFFSSFASQSISCLLGHSNDRKDTNSQSHQSQRNYLSDPFSSSGGISGNNMSNNNDHLDISRYSTTTNNTIYNTTLRRESSAGSTNSSTELPPNLEYNMFRQFLSQVSEPPPGDASSNNHHSNTSQMLYTNQGVGGYSER